MTCAVSNESGARASDPQLLHKAFRVIAPSWPLDRQIAVNPLWGMIDQPFADAAARLHTLIGARFTMPPDYYAEAWRTNGITVTAFKRALDETAGAIEPEHAFDALRAPPSQPAGLPLLSDMLDRRNPVSAGPRWSDTITQQVSQYCAARFDEQQADWQGRRATDLYSDWRRTLQVDHALEPLMHTPRLRARAHELPLQAQPAIDWALQRLSVAPASAEPLLQTCLLRINGWASWCAYLAWEAALQGSSDESLQQLLAIRLCWEALLDDGRRDTQSVWRQWHDQWHQALKTTRQTPLSPLSVWQRAQEISYQDHLIGLLSLRPPASHQAANPDRPAAQLAFCIDVRSERLRRAVESLTPQVQTLGFAGFFGLPIQYRPLGSTLARPQLPGLLAPAHTVSDSSEDPDEDARLAQLRRGRLTAEHQREAFVRSPTGAFSLVECMGLGYAGQLLQRHFGMTASAPTIHGLPNSHCHHLRPHFAEPLASDLGGRVQLAASILRAMNLTSGFARLVVLVGHGSQSANNPQAAALDCGACGGQTGEINARVLALLLNDPQVRSGLARQRILLPLDTVAVAALHNTTTDEVQLLDLADVPASHTADIDALHAVLLQASARTRVERAPDLGLDTVSNQPEALLRALKRRATDWAQTRPEWGLANNAAFIVAPRTRTRGLNLAGRSFLHDYDWSSDPDNTVLELIMTAPMVVTHWINLQYYASTVQPERFGSGNKILHNVACGRIGVFEGNTGDLRVGLSLQSLHDGARWMHAPLRLSVFIDAPRERIDAVIARHEVVRNLVMNQWLYLLRFAENDMECRTERGWQKWKTPSHTT